MSTRIRQFTKNEQLDDKLISLGKISAGLAHELNNPSAAVVRSAKELSRHLRFLPEKFKAVAKIRMDDTQIDAVNQLLFDKLKSGMASLKLMERSRQEDALIDWLMDHNIEEPEELAESLVDYGFSPNDLERVASQTPAEQLSPILHWMQQVLSTEKMVGEIEEASGRIHQLVGSIKRYTHMDQAPEKTSSDVHEGLESTLNIMNHKIKQQQIRVIRKYGENLPKPEILPGTLNQVWTNLIDNAIDAMEDSDTKMLVIRTSANDQFFMVEIEDSGSGIPEEIQDKIYDPFFTTKPVGKGTGLGMENVLQIVKVQHNGSIDLRSQPGQTIFTICIPLKNA
jgi:signal transduction histidine kinase